MLIANFYILPGLICLSTVHCILTKTDTVAASEKHDIKKTDNEVAQSIDRDYIAGYEDNYGHGGYGLSAHVSYGYPEGHEGYGTTDGSKHHIHHTEDHHHYHHDHPSHHKHYDYDHKALAIKSLLVPLAGVALLGAAAAFVSNPILLQLGVISSSSLGRKKRGAVSNSNSAPLKAKISQEDQIRLNEIKLLERFIAQIPEQDIKTQEKKMLANYMSCSGITTDNLCLERLACELHSTEGTSMTLETNVLTIVVNEILENDFIPDNTKVRLSKAMERGKKHFDCRVYECQQLEKSLKNRLR